MIINGNSDNFNELINEDFVLVDFYALWCGPCKMLSPVLEELSEKTNIKIVKINVDENEELARKYGVMSIPTLMIFKKGELKSTKNGFMPTELLEDWINETREI